MLKASGSLATDDVAIRCRVRHSPFATNREFSEPAEMICTMRMWNGDQPPPSAHSGLASSVGLKKARSYGSYNGDDTRLMISGLTPHRQFNGPELLLRSAKPKNSVARCNSGELGRPLNLSKRFASFGSQHDDGDNVVPNSPVNFRPQNITPNRRRRSNESSPTPQQRHQRVQSHGQVPSQVDASSKEKLNVQTTPMAECEEYRIPIHDIMVVDMYGVGDSHRTNITTLSHGYFEFTLENRNGQEILLAFLKSSLPKERIMDGNVPRSPSGFSQRTNSTSSRSFDVEAFTASRMAERMREESFSEKLRRRVGRVVSSIEEISNAITECACGCAKNAPQSSPPQHYYSEKRDSPPRNPPQYNYDVVELAPESPDGKLVNGKTMNVAKRREMFKQCNLPSGLSVECDPEMEWTNN